MAMQHDAPEIPRITAPDLYAAAELIVTRCSSASREAERIARLRTMLRATAGLNRTLNRYAQHALVHCQGSAGTSDLSADTVDLIQALQRFCTELHEVASVRDRFVESDSDTRTTGRPTLVRARA
jgi:hypothetical protein